MTEPIPQESISQPSSKLLKKRFKYDKLENETIILQALFNKIKHDILQQEKQFGGDIQKEGTTFNNHNKHISVLRISLAFLQKQMLIVE